MGSSTNDNDKPVLAVKEDPPMFAKLFRHYVLPRFIHSVIIEMSSRRDKLSSAFNKFDRCTALIRNKTIAEVVEHNQKQSEVSNDISFSPLIHSSSISDTPVASKPEGSGIGNTTSTMLLLGPSFHWLQLWLFLQLLLLFLKTGVVEELRRSYENIKNKRFVCAGKKTEVQFWLNIEAILSHYRYAGGLHSTNLSGVWCDFQCGFEECSPNHFTAVPVNKEKQRSITGNMSSRIDNNELYWSNNTYEYNQHIIRKEIVRRSSSFVVSTIVVLGIFYNICSSQLSIINFPPLHKERNVSIWLSLLGLVGFMVLVCAVAVMIIVRAPFTSMQKSMLIFWAILMHLQSAKSIIEVFLTLVGGLFMVWYTFGKKQPPNDVMM